MKKLWSYIAFVFLGIIAGMVIMFEVAKKSISNTTIKGRIKQKKNTASTLDVTNTISQEKQNKPAKRIDKKLTRKARKLKRLQTKIEKV